jgi:hypothetical protein
MCSEIVACRCIAVENNIRRICETSGCETAKMVVGTPAGLGRDVCHVTQQTVISVGPANVLKLLQVSRVGSFDGT